MLLYPSLNIGLPPHSQAGFRVIFTPRISAALNHCGNRSGVQLVSQPSSKDQGSIW